MTQETALSILKTGANVFLTGEPGSGKTHTVNTYVHYLREHNIEPSITASTGIAATHIGGMTIHSWSGVGIRKVLTEYDLDRLETNESLVRRITKAKVLIIDEISMLDGKLLDMIEQITRTLRKSEQPFGGLQVIFVGDFFQLPPIAEKGSEAQFCYSSVAWKKADLITCYLSEQHRQDDQAFLSTLGAIRRGELEDSVFEYITERQIFEETLLEGIPRLYTHNIDVDKKNQEELAKLPGDSYDFPMESRGTPTRIEQLTKGCLSPSLLSLKQGAQVMFTKNNFELGYVNGTLGEVIDFDKESTFPVVETKSGKTILATPAEWAIEDAGKVLATITQIPLRLAWAITVHKSQGMSLDAALMDLRHAFEYGQGYVALSRVRTFAGLHIAGINQRAFEVHPLVLAQDELFREQSIQAEDRFLNMDTGELKQLHNNFIIAVGGNLKKQAVSSSHKEKSKLRTHEETLLLLLQGMNISAIAEARGLKTNTIFDHIEYLYEKKLVKREKLAHLVTPLLQKNMGNIHALFKKLETTKLTPVFESLDGKHSFDDLRIARLFLDP